MCLCFRLKSGTFVSVMKAMETTGKGDAQYVTSRLILSVTTFVGAQMMLLILCSFIWGQFVTDKLYNCTDEVGFDFLRPGNWVHGNVEYVEKVDDGRSMSMPDTIKVGWSKTGLWSLWLAMFGPSLVISVLPAIKVWNAVGRHASE
jgi:hypothetical protein